MKAHDKANTYCYDSFEQAISEALDLWPGDSVCIGPIRYVALSDGTIKCEVKR